MKALLTATGFGLALILGGVVLFQSKKVERLQEEIHQARRQTAELEASLMSGQEQAAGADAQLRQIRQQASEVPRLRGQVDSLQNQLDSLRAQYTQATQTVAAIHQEKSQALSQETVVRHVTEERQISLTEVPPAIQSFIQRQYAGATIHEAVRIAEEDGVHYSIEGSTANDRNWHAVFDENGDLLEQVMELSVHEVPESVRASLHQQVGADTAVNMEQVWEEGRTIFTGNAEWDGQEMHMVFSEDGRLLRYETWVEEPEIERFE